MIMIYPFRKDKFFKKGAQFNLNTGSASVIIFVLVIIYLIN